MNTYFKMLNSGLQNQYKNDIICDVQNELKQGIRTCKLNLHDFLHEDKSKVNYEKYDINVLLKYYLINQLIKNNTTNDKNEDKKDVFKDTKNPNIKINEKDNSFYKLSENVFVKNENIESVNQDGTYILVEQRNTSSYEIKTLCDINDRVLQIWLIGPDGQINKNKWHVAEILGMKKEYTHKFKYAGYSGNSSDLIASLLNKLTSPIETGFYMDKKYNLYKWSDLNHSFIRNINIESQSPLLSDYEFVNNIVIKKEYIGINK